MCSGLRDTRKTCRGIMSQDKAGGLLLVLHLQKKERDCKRESCSYHWGKDHTIGAGGASSSEPCQSLPLEKVRQKLLAKEPIDRGHRSQSPRVERKTARWTEVKGCKWQFQLLEHVFTDISYCLFFVWTGISIFSRNRLWMGCVKMESLTSQRIGKHCDRNPCIGILCLGR